MVLSHAKVGVPMKGTVVAGAEMVTRQPQMECIMAPLGRSGQGMTRMSLMPGIEFVFMWCGWCQRMYAPVVTGVLVKIGAEVNLI